MIVLKIHWRCQVSYVMSPCKRGAAAPRALMRSFLLPRTTSGSPRPQRQSATSPLHRSSVLHRCPFCHGYLTLSTSHCQPWGSKKGQPLKAKTGPFLKSQVDFTTVGLQLVCYFPPPHPTPYDSRGSSMSRPTVSITPASLEMDSGITMIMHP